MRNCHPSLPWESKATHLTTLNVRMKMAGYHQGVRERVTRRTIAKYTTSLTNMQVEGRPMYRTREEREVQVLKAGGKTTSSNWFKKVGYSNTLTLQASINSNLTSKVKVTLQDTQAPSNYNTLLLEDGGFSIKQDLVRSNPSPEQSCGRLSCLPCASSPSKGLCRRSNVNYLISCKRPTCIDNTTYTYAGESSRTGFTRASQHLALYRGNLKEKEKSFMYRHCLDSHDGIIGPADGLDDFTMKITSHSTKPLTRILEEGVEVKDLENSNTVTCLNSKSEYYQPQYIRVTYAKGARGPG